MAADLYLVSNIEPSEGESDGPASPEPDGAATPESDDWQAQIGRLYGDMEDIVQESDGSGGATSNGATNEDFDSASDEDSDGADEQASDSTAVGVSDQAAASRISWLDDDDMLLGVDDEDVEV
jgi:hypothetical protein